MGFVITKISAVSRVTCRWTHRKIFPFKVKNLLTHTLIVIRLEINKYKLHFEFSDVELIVNTCKESSLYDSNY